MKAPRRIEMSFASRNCVVLGLGNILHSDDGAGCRAADLLKDDSRLPKGVKVIDGGTLGLELLPELWDCTDLLVLDAVDVSQAPGTLVRLSGDELSKLSGCSNVHQLGVADLLVAVRLLAYQAPKVVLLGIQPSSVEWGSTLSQPVRGGLPLLVDAAITELWVASACEPPAPGLSVTQSASLK
jgi:hydrogenase maturation protease